MHIVVKCTLAIGVRVVHYNYACVPVYFKFFELSYMLMIFLFQCNVIPSTTKKKHYMWYNL